MESDRKKIKEATRTTIKTITDWMEAALVELTQ
jgi:hypothetical protein